MNLEPYSVRVVVHVGSQPVAAEAFLIRLLEDLAAACVASGASVIGHIKCLLHTAGGVAACSLTSTRSGAACAARKPEAAEALPSGTDAPLELAVLVYGLPASTLAHLAGEALTGALAPLGARWSVTP